MGQLGQTPLLQSPNCGVVILNRQMHRKEHHWTAPTPSRVLKGSRVNHSNAFGTHQKKYYRELYCALSSCSMDVFPKKYYYYGKSYWLQDRILMLFCFKSNIPSLV